MRKISGAILIVGFAIGVLGFSNVAADTAATFVPVSGTDATGDSPSAMTASSSGDIFKFSLSDDKRMATNAAWPGTGAYDENKYIELVFSPGIPDGSVVSSVTVTHEYRRNTILTAAKLEIWDGNAWDDVPLSLPDTTGTDLSETKDISSFLTTSAAVNGLKMRFLAYRDTVATSSTTSHDYLVVTVNYNSATPSATDTPTPSDTATPSPTTTPTISSTPTPTTSATPSPSPATSAVPTPTYQASYGSSFTPTPTPSVSKTPTPTPKVSATPTPSVTVTPTAIPLTAEIAAAITTPTPLPTPIRRYYAKKKPAPTPTPEPTPTPRMSVVQLITPPIIPIAFHHLASFLRRIF